MRWSEAGYLSRIMLTHAPRQASVSLILGVRQIRSPSARKSKNRKIESHQRGDILRGGEIRNIQNHQPEEIPISSKNGNGLFVYESRWKTEK
jgi:hypothetical protein